MTDIANRPKARLTTLGQLSLTLVASDGTPRVLLKPGKPLALVTYLALSPRHSARPSPQPAFARTPHKPVVGRLGFRTRASHSPATVWQMRQTLVDLAIVDHGRGLVLAMPMSSDRNDFLNAVAQNDVAAAVAMYIGPFLPDFGVPGNLRCAPTGVFSYWGSASVILGATPIWGDRQTSFVDLAPLANELDYRAAHLG